MTADLLDAYLDRPTGTAFRYEGRGQYLVGGDEAKRIEAFAGHKPRPVRSVRTSPWLAHIAVTTITSGKIWQRAIRLDDPLNDYQRYRIAGMIESQAAGEDIWIIAREVRRTPDFWLFDDEDAVIQDYDDDSRPAGQRLVTDPAELAALVHFRRVALSRSVSLNEYLAAHVEALRAA